MGEHFCKHCEKHFNEANDEIMRLHDHFDRMFRNYDKEKKRRERLGLPL